MYKTMPLLLLFLFLAAGFSAVGQEAWREELPPEHFKKFNQFQRAQYKKAMDLFAKEQYKAATAEWEKFRLEFEAEMPPELVGYLILMQGRSQHLAKNRNQAIKTYTEVLDYFQDVVWIAAPAIFFRGIANLDNGDIRLGMLDMKKMVENDKFRTHPLAAGALRRLADNHWRNNEPDLAVKYWKQTVDELGDVNQEEARNARHNVFSYYIKEQRFDQIVSWAGGKNKDNPKTRAWIAETAANVAYHGFGGDWGKFKDKDKEKAEAMAAYFDWYCQQKSFYEQTDPWRWYDSALVFLCHRYGPKAEREKWINDALQYIKTAKTEDRVRNERYAWMIDRLREARELVMARLVIASIVNDPAYAGWKEYELLGWAENKWKEAAEQLERIEAMKNDYWVKRSKWERANIYKDRLGQYEKAIKLYEEIGEPPQTLWEIQVSYRRWGKKDEAQKTLTEIASMFPDWAPRAVYEKAEIYREAGDKDKAIAIYRQILKNQEWKKTGEASQAHQRLEAYGIATGGGQIEEQ